RRRDRDDRGDPAPPRSEAQCAADRGRRPRGGAAGGAADLLCHRDHHHDLRAAVRVPAHRGEAVLSDGLRDRLRAARRAAVRAGRGARPGLSRLPPAAPRLPQSRAGVDRGGLSARARRLPAASRHRLPAPGRRRGARRATVWREFLPELDEGSVWLHAELPPGISLPKATEMIAELRRAANEFPEVAYVVTHIGRNDDGTDPWTPSHMEAAVGLTPYS